MVPFLPNFENIREILKTMTIMLILEEKPRGGFEPKRNLFKMMAL